MWQGQLCSFMVPYVGLQMMDSRLVEVLAAVEVDKIAGELSTVDEVVSLTGAKMLAGKILKTLATMTRCV